MVPDPYSATPCPVPASTQFDFNADTITGTIAAECANLRPMFRDVAPRKRRTTRNIGTVAVYEDAGDENKVDATSLAARPRRRESMALVVKQQSVGSRTAATVGTNVGAERESAQGELRKPARRRTIFIPSDDTTILTIHPGSYSHVNPPTMSLDPSFSTRTTLSTFNNTSMTTTMTRTSSSSRPRPRHSLAAAPKRGPLLPSLRVVQEESLPWDRAGCATGKENVPPGSLMIGEVGKDGKKKPRNTGSKVRRGEPVAVNGSAVSGRLENRNAAPKTEMNQQLGNIMKCKARKSSIQPVIPITVSDYVIKPANDLPVKLIKPAVKLPEAAPIQYPLVQEDISQPQMFEETWLSNQETAVTELINSLFTSANSSVGNGKLDMLTLRHDMMQMYQQPVMSLLYKRIQASLLYGALSLPKETLPETTRVVNDIRIRRKFVHLWMKTYNVAVLQAALEVVVGRETSIASSPSSSTSTKIHEMEKFIERCLLDNEDASQPIKSQIGAASWSWRRTMHRSLMLINLMDQAKDLDTIPTHLFRKSSVHKSSIAVLKELTALLLLSGGELTRALSHLDYHIKHVQYPLSEYDYTIQNLAADLRDGVRLTHLVELLLYPSMQLSQEAEDTTVMMPCGEVLTSLANDKSFGVLSQHLKYPCLGRVQKVYNVQIAMSALQGVRGVASIADNIRPEDIVDGHREKTMIMLWGLVGNWGLDRLVDRNDLEEEIRRLGRDGDKDESIPDEESISSPHLASHTRLLRRWATAVAQKHGLRVHNLTSSFADGKVFNCLVDEYHRYLTPLTAAAVTSEATLDFKLKKLGCSPSFGKTNSHHFTHTVPELTR